jgi:multicomponent Na+:H+ antiporter subunit D
MQSLLLLLPLIVLLFLNLPIGGWFRRAGFWLVVALALGQILVAAVPALNFFSQDPTGISKLLNLSLSVDMLTRLLLLSIGIVALTALLVCCGMVKEEKKRWNFVDVLLLLVVGMNGVVLVSDIFSMYVFIEVIGVASFILIAFNKDRDALESGFKYLVFSSIATIMMLSSIALILLFSPDVTFASIARAVIDSRSSHLMLFAIALFICGMFIKGGVMPFHGWLPDAYSFAPNATSVLLAGIVTKAAGIYPLIRIVYTVFGATNPLNAVLMFIGAVTIVIAAFSAITQSDFKRMLAYSSISQIGYIVLSLGTGTVLGLAGAVFHLFNHSIFKSLLFVNSAAVESQTNSRDIDKMGGLAQKMPWTGVTSALASLSVSGIPPLSGFWSKLIIIIALWTSNNYFYAMIAVLASLVTLVYMLTLQRKVFFGKLADNLKNIKEADRSLVVPAVILAAIMIAVSFLFPFLLGSFMIPIGGI